MTNALRTLARGVGQLLITAGVVILLFVAYELWFTGYYTQAQQQTLKKTFARELIAPPPTSKAGIAQLKNPPLGSGIAILRIPRLGKHFVFVVVEGTGYTDLQKGPGHYPGTANPGDVGNFAVAGHRTTYLHPFYNLNEMRAGDHIYLETRDHEWYTYEVENIPGTAARWKEIVQPTAIDVAYQVPDQSDEAKKPTQKVLTFTTCNPRYSASQRLVIHALLVAKSATQPDLVV